MNDVINLASLYKDKIKQHKIAEEVSKNISNTKDLSEESTLYKAALIIGKELEDVRGIKYQPLNPSDISEETAENLIPDKLYTFVTWLLSSKQAESPEIISKNDIKEKYPSLHRYILSLAQDMLFMKSRGEVRTPKHVGLSITCHKMTQSKIVLQMLNRHGHGTNYSEVQREDTSWANKQLDDNYIVLPSNIKPGVFTHASADNWNRATDSITGKHLDIVNMVLFQDSNTTSADFGELQIGHRTRRRSVDQRARRSPQIIRCPNLHGKNPRPIHLKGSVSIDWYFTCSNEHNVSRRLDLAWVFSRLCPKKLFEIDFQRSEKQKCQDGQYSMH